MSVVKYHLGNFPPTTLEWNKLIPLIGPANAAIARYDSLLTAIPNADVLLSPLTTDEAVLSSRIEGTQATIGEVLEFEADGNIDKYSDEKRHDIQEVLNYRKAMRHAISRLEELPLSVRIILEVHKVLMDSVRGHGKSPGEFRKIPNWIGSAGCTIETARYIPISAENLPGHMSDFEKYIHFDTIPDKLVQLAILHAEFEALHPFLDGNGRLGRMLVPLFLWQKGLIRQPMFYISSFLESNREEYYNRLLDVSKNNNWTDWCVFFLKALTSQAISNEKKASDILNLYNNKKRELSEIINSQYFISSLDWIFEHPIFNNKDFIKSSGIPEPTARRIINLLKNNNIISVIMKPAGRRSAVYVFSELLNIAEGRIVF
ncbi:MAG: Fic family protein [Sedimentisphaerales bacterium]|nr:Fic family protein [Sedimentisphaerales bacterium]MBN2843861.1 Fic family protein [Sedimentisphaerales bacterium]